MNGNCCNTEMPYYGRGFLTREEKIEMLEEYKKSLEKETQGVKEKIEQLRQAAAA